MEKLSLPKILETNKSQSTTKKKHTFTNQFASLLKKYIILIFKLNFNF